MVAYTQQEHEGQLRLTPQEYLQRERMAESKSEYHGGVIVAMAGATWEHNLITGNVERYLGNRLEGSPCVVVSKDQRVRVPECDRYYYPDVVVVCEEPQFEDAELDTLLNPTLIIEVLSESTEAKDRGEKWICYQTLGSLQAYVLISQDRPVVEIYRRQADGWFYSVAIGMESAVSLESIGCELKLADVYARLRFQAPPGEQAS